jgi:hypothetical protein
MSHRWMKSLGNKFIQTRSGPDIQIAEPRQIDFDVTPEVFAAVRKGRMTVPLGIEPDLAVVAGLPWGSIATVHSAGDKLYRIVGPAIWQTDKKSLPVFPTDADGLAACETDAASLRRSLGLVPALA